MPQELYKRSPMRILNQHLGEGLRAGEIGVIVAKPGVGKSPLLVHIALDALLREISVLHVSLREAVDHVRAYYDEIFGAISRAGRIPDRASAMVAAERHRMIHSYLDRGFEVAHLRSNLQMLDEVAHFKPRMVVIDGLRDRDLPTHLPALSALAKDLAIPLWLTVRTRSSEDARVPEDAWEHVRIALSLTPTGRTVKLSLVNSDGREDLPFLLDPTTMLVLSDEQDEVGRTRLAPRPSDCTLYSGGANGSEALFGEEAEKWGAHEVNFTFDGHKQARARGRYELSPRELAAGDVSLVYVSRRLRRTYSEGSLIRRVLQTLWHMVSRSQQVFVLGHIQEDGTVVGGTGWSVELAKMWNKNLWVFDQRQAAWFRWDGDQWLPGTPVVESIHLTGTGTRYPTEEGKEAVRELFERSFAPRMSE
jgi:hypothetical protein